MTNLVDIHIRPTSTKPIQPELLMRVPLPAKRRHRLHAHGRDTVRDDLQTVLLALGVEDLEARHADHARFEVVVVLHVLDGLDADANLGARAHERDVRALGLDADVPALDAVLDRRRLQVRQVLTRQRQDAGRGFGRQGDVVGGAGLVAVGGAPDHHVGESAEVGQRLDRLVGGAVLAEADGVVCRDVDDAAVGESGEADGAGGVGDEVQEGAAEGDDGPVGGETVHDAGHGVLAHTVADVAAAPVADTKVWGLEVDSVLPTGVVGSGQVCGAADEVRDDPVDRFEDGLGKLSGRGGFIGGLVGWQLCLPAFRELAAQTPFQVIGFLVVFLAVFVEHLGPLLLLGSAFRRMCVIHIIHFLGDNEGFLGVEAEFLFNLFTVIRLQRVPVHPSGTLQERAETNCGCEFDD